MIATLAARCDGGATTAARRPSCARCGARRASDPAAVADEVDGPVRALLARQRGRVHGHARRDPRGRGRPGRGDGRTSTPRSAIADAGTDAAVHALPGRRPRRLGPRGDPASPPCGARSACAGDGVRDRHASTPASTRAATDLAGKIAAWRDFVAGSPTPVDENGHGTHTAGTMVGGSAGGAPIGVAPGAKLIVARAMGANGVGHRQRAAGRRRVDDRPGRQPGARADQPAIVNNSWSASTANDTWFRPMIRRWLDLGIVPVFAAGNNGPTTGSVGSPAGYPEAIAVGAIDTDDGVPSLLEPRPGRVAEHRRPRPRGGHGAAEARPGGARRGHHVERRHRLPLLLGHVDGRAARGGRRGAACARRTPRLGARQRRRHPARRRPTTSARPAPTPPPASAGSTRCGRVEAAVGPAPDTRFTATPPATSPTPAPLVYAVAALRRRRRGAHPRGRRRRGAPRPRRHTLAPDPPRGPARGRGPGDRRGRGRRPHPRPPRGDGRPHRARARGSRWSRAGTRRGVPRHGHGRAERRGPRTGALELRRGRDRRAAPA